MTMVPLRLGTLAGQGYRIQRSGIRWLFEDGHLCRPGEPIAFCNVAVVLPGGPPNSAPFLEEFRDFQVAFAPRCGGRLSISGPGSEGGFLDQLPQRLWDPDLVIGYLDCPDNAASGTDETELRLLTLAGRRMTELAEVRSGLLTGWHGRSRAWWGEAEADPGTLLSMGNCEQLGIIRGERQAYMEIFELVPGPAQVVHVMHEPLVPCAPVVIDQLRRTRAESEAIATDLASTFPAGPVVPTSGSWMFAGALLASLRRCPLTDIYTVLTRSGLRHTRPADAVVLSISCEQAVLLRHRKLGYTVSCHGFRIVESGTAMRAWLRNGFEPVQRTICDIRRDYDELIDLIRARSAMKILIMNQISSAAYENIYNYAPFDLPMASTLAGIYAKEVNLMLHELARERDVAIVDVDAIAAEFGIGRHIPDGMHQSGQMQGELRREIVRILAEQSVPGFTGARLS